MILRLADLKNRDCPGRQGQLNFVAGKTGGCTTEQQLQMLSALERGIRERNFQIAGSARIVVNDEHFFIWRLTQKSVVTVVPANMPLLSRAQHGMLSPQGQQRLHMRKDVLLLLRPAAGGEGVTRISG